MTERKHLMEDPTPLVALVARHGTDKAADLLGLSAATVNKGIGSGGCRAVTARLAAAILAEEDRAATRLNVVVVVLPPEKVEGFRAVTLAMGLECAGLILAEGEEI